MKEGKCEGKPKGYCTVPELVTMEHSAQARRDEGRRVCLPEARTRERHKALSGPQPAVTPQGGSWEVNMPMSLSSCLPIFSSGLPIGQSQREVKGQESLGSSALGSLGGGGESRWQRVSREAEGPWKTPSVMLKVKLDTIPWFHWEPGSHYSLHSCEAGLVLSFIRRPFNHTCCVPLGPTLGSYKVQDLVKGLDRKPP